MMDAQISDRLNELTERRDQLAAGVQKGLTELEQLNGAIAVLGEFVNQEDEGKTLQDDKIGE
tara:strand:+ start:14154 stop:14339 length:186 start_codon:yes stop_codon:yes gene_type:complete